MGIGNNAFAPSREEIFSSTRLPRAASLSYPSPSSNFFYFPFFFFFFYSPAEATMRNKKRTGSRGSVEGEDERISRHCRRPGRCVAALPLFFRRTKIIPEAG